MNSKNLFNFINKIVLSSLVLIVSMVAISANPSKATEAQKKIIGVWQLQKNVSGKQSKQIKPEFFPVPVDFAPESLILAADDEVTEITINEEFKEFVNTQTLPTDGTVVTKTIDLIGKVSSKATWVGKKLVVEINTSKGDKIIETFEISANQKHLMVNLQMSNNRSAKVTKMRRVYNRVAEPTEEKTAQVGIAGYPL